MVCFGDSMSVSWQSLCYVRQHGDYTESHILGANRVLLCPVLHHQKGSADAQPLTQCLNAGWSPMVDLAWVTSVKRLPATFETNLSEKCLSLVFEQKVSNKSELLL